MLVWAPSEEDVRRIGPLPPELGLELEAFPPDPLSSPRLPEVEVLIPPYEPPEHRRVLESMARMPRLRLVQALTGGVDWLLPGLPEGVTCCRSGGVYDGVVAEWVVGVVLGMQRALFVCRDLQREGRWETVIGRELSGQTVALVGYGLIAQAVERCLRPFRPRIERVARMARPGVHAVSELGRVLGECDVVVLLVPLTSATEQMVGREFLAAMPDDALLVNAARGRVVDTEALAAEVLAGRLRAALDVTDPEPLPAGHLLWRAPGAFVSPHIAGAPIPPMPQAAVDLARRQVLRFAAGAPLAYRVDGEY